MKDREEQILKYIIERQHAGIQELLTRFRISKRTLYYDIESINFYIRHCGRIRNIKGSFTYIGQYDSLEAIFFDNQVRFEHVKDRVQYILYRILNDNKTTIDGLAAEMNFSKNTVVQMLEIAKDELSNLNLTLCTKPYYHITGDEVAIRNLYLLLLQEDSKLLSHVNHKVKAFDVVYNLNLTDYSLASISKLLSFINTQNSKGIFIPSLPYVAEVQQFKFYKGVAGLLRYPNELEQVYLSAYIATCSSKNTQINENRIENYIDQIIRQFEVKTAITLDNKEEFKLSMKRHLLSSYYRIKYHFPIYNPILDEIKIKHEALFRIIKSILENTADFPDFQGIREEEIGFIAAYFGGYVKSLPIEGERRKKILLVCPNGLMVSKALEIQLTQSIPMIDIVDVVSIKELSNYHKNYDYIVSTVELPDYQNVIVVHPLLTKVDINRLMRQIVNMPAGFHFIDVEQVMSVISKHAKISDEEKLKKELAHIFYHANERELYQPMLKDLLNKKRIQKIKSVSDWKQAIAFAAKPLLEDQSITQEYIDAMIGAVEEHGPYIVLADGFALPHASVKSGVNQLSMSLLVLEEAVDLLGKPVNLLMVLATIDNTTHIRALASLTELLYEEKNLNVFRTGNSDAILKLIAEHEKEEVM